MNPAQIKKFRPSVVLHDVKSIGAYLRNEKIFVFDGCQLFVRYSEMVYIFHGCNVNCRVYKNTANFGFQSPLTDTFTMFKEVALLYRSVKPK